MKTYKPYTPSMRFKSVLDKSYFSNYNIHFLSKYTCRAIGKSKGKIVCRFKHKKVKKKITIIDFFRNKHANTPFKVVLMKHDCFRTAFVSLCCSFNGVYAHILASDGLNFGSVVFNWSNFTGYLHEGDHISLLEMPFGSLFFNVELCGNKGGQVAKSAGSSCYFINKFDNLNQALIELPSGKRINISLSCNATVGFASNKRNKYICLGNASRSFYLGKRPHTRGVAMNPVDHPHGGGEGKKSGRSCPYSPWRKQPLFKKNG
jgi:large subunit ribosomal protein L2